MSIANDLEDISERLRAQAGIINACSNCDYEDYGPLLDLANEIDEICEKLRH